MKRSFLSVLAALLFLTPCFAKVDPAIDKAHDASYHIAQGTITGGGECSATAIGPHALLTATHCEEPTDDIEILGKVEGDAIIVDRLRDSLDHTILFVKNISFPVWVDVLEQKPELAQNVFTFGNPGNFEDIFERGCVAGIKEDHSMAAALSGGRPPLILFTFPTFPGDSGSGVFNDAGVLIAVVGSYISQENESKEASIVFAGAYPLHFKKEALDKARTFTVADDAPVAPEKK